MRVTDKMRYQQPNRRINRLRTRQVDVSEQLSSGLRINRPSDDPLGALRVSAIGTEQRRVDQFERALRTADTQLQQADGVLGESTDVMQRIKELTIRGLNSSASQADVEIIADEIASLRDTLFSLANTQVEGRYLFSGYRLDTPPYDAQFAFQGDANVQEVEVGLKTRVPVSVNGGSAFGDGTANTVDVFDNLVQLEASIRARVEAPIQDELERLETSLEQVVGARSRVGIAINRVDAARSMNTYLDAKLPIDMAGVRDVDFTEAVSEMTLVDNTLQATLSVSSSLVNGPSLLDFLR